MVLLVEDNPMDVELLIARLQAAGVTAEMQIDTASSLAGALELMALHAYDLILLDLMLPDSSGIGTFERIFQRQPMTPIVVFTAVDEQSISRQLIALGAQDFIEKDKISVNGLRQQLTFAMGRRQASAKVQKRVQADSIYWLADAMAAEFNHLFTRLLSQLQSIEEPLRDAPEALRDARQASDLILTGTDVMHVLLELSRPASKGRRQSAAELLNAMLDSLRQHFGDTVSVSMADTQCDWHSHFDDTQFRTLLFQLITNCARSIRSPTCIVLHLAGLSGTTIMRMRDGQIPPGEYLRIRIEIAAVSALEVDDNSGLLLSAEPAQQLIEGFVMRNGGYIADYRSDGKMLCDLLLPRAVNSAGNPNTLPARIDIRSVLVVVVAADNDESANAIYRQIEMLGFNVQKRPNLQSTRRFVASGQRIDLLVMHADTLDSSGQALIDDIAAYCYDLRLLICGNVAERTAPISVPSVAIDDNPSLARLDDGLRAALGHQPAET